jgi:catechol O-methyltransferase
MPFACPSRTLRGAVATAAGAALLATRARGPAKAALALATVGAGAVAANEVTGKQVPMLRWSFLRLILGLKKLTTEWQVGDGREEAAAEYVVRNARSGDIDDVIATIDRYCRTDSFLINVGDEKGEILDAAVRAVQPAFVLELGTYVGYGAMRLARAAPDARVVSVEFVPANAAIARRIIEHAGLSGRITVVEGTLADGGKTLEHLHTVLGLGPGGLDAVFLDHAKDHYLSDLHRLEDSGWLHAGSVVVADNIRFPGAPDYRSYLQEQEGLRWRTVEHETHAEYQRVIKDLVLQSTYLGPGGPTPQT